MQTYKRQRSEGRPNNNSSDQTAEVAYDAKLKRRILNPPFVQALSANSSMVLSFLMNWESLQRATIYPPGFQSVQYELVAEIPRTFGWDVRVLGNVQGSLIQQPVGLNLYNGSSQAVARLSANWVTCVTFAKAAITPGIEAAQSNMIYRGEVIATADNAQGGDGNIVRGMVTTGIPQNFSGDVYTNMSCTTIQKSSYLQANVTYRATLKTEVVTIPSTIRVYTIQDLVGDGYSLNNNAILFTVPWSDPYIGLIGTTGVFASYQKVSLGDTFIVPYGVLPFLYIGDPTVQVWHLLLTYGDATSGLLLKWVTQPLETLGMANQSAWDGTWVGCIVFTTNQALCTFSGSSALPLDGQFRMYCPPNAAVALFQNLSFKQTIFVKGYAEASAVPAQQNYVAFSNPSRPIDDAEIFWQRQSPVVSDENKEGRWTLVNTSLRT